MKKFMDENFLLESETAQMLFFKYAKDMPIYDFHCHTVVSDVASDRTYENLTQLWLYTDHYKWRAMRLFGIDEKYITGDSSDYEKFEAYATALEGAIGNPIYHWTHLELQRYFGIDTPLSKKTAREIFDKTCEIMKSGEISAKRLLEKSKVVALCSTDDPADTLEYHIKLKEEGYGVKILPSFRPDFAVCIEEAGFVDYIAKLGNACTAEISSVAELKSALAGRLDFFCEVGCVISDHGFVILPFEECTSEEAEAIFQKKINGDALSLVEIDKFKTYMMCFLGESYSEKGVTMQLHTGSIRNVNSNLMDRLGPNTGGDSIGDDAMALNTAKFLDALDKKGKLPHTILYTSNPKDNHVLATMMANFPESGVGSKVQFGPAWWFNDHLEGMKEQMKAFSAAGVLSTFVGMLTDSRSFTAYVRHEYFRRILCNMIGGWVENGEYPADEEVLGKMIQDICYNNVVEYLK